MKKPIMIFAAVVLMAALASTAKAVPVNPAQWTFALETQGTNQFWTSDTNVPTDFPQYDYDWQLTGAELEVDIGGGNFSWVDVKDRMPEEYKSVSGTGYGLPVNILDPLHIEWPQPPEQENPAIILDVYASVDESGYGHVSIRDITLGQLEEVGGQVFDVVSARFDGELTVNAVPEPATVLLLGLGSLVLLRRPRM
jgi:hypothetical protein